MRDGSFSGSATAFGGYARADPEGSSGGLAQPGPAWDEPAASGMRGTDRSTRRQW